MIAPDLTITASVLWQELSHEARVGVQGPHRCNLPGHELCIEAKVEHGRMFALISAHGRDVETHEELAIKAACGVPKTAERAPLAGQEIVPRYRRGIVDERPMHQITFWWSLDTSQRPRS